MACKMSEKPMKNAIFPICLMYISVLLKKKNVIGNLCLNIFIMFRQMLKSSSSIFYKDNLDMFRVTFPIYLFLLLQKTLS